MTPSVASYPHPEVFQIKSGMAGLEDLQRDENQRLENDYAGFIAQEFLQIAKAPPLKIECAVKGLVDKFEGDKLVVSRDRGVDSTGLLAEKLYRILQIRKSPEEARTEIVAVEDI